MGYDVSIKIKELDSKYKPSFDCQEDEINKQLLILESVCLNIGASMDEKCDPFMYSRIYDTIKRGVSMYLRCVENEIKAHIKKLFDTAEVDENGNHTIDFRGWGYADEYSKNDEYSYEKELSSMMEVLFPIATTKFADRYSEDENERERYYQKRDSIDDYLREQYEHISDMIFESFFFDYKHRPGTILDGDDYNNSVVDENGFAKKYEWSDWRVEDIVKSNEESEWEDEEDYCRN